MKVSELFKKRVHNLHEKLVLVETFTKKQWEGFWTGFRMVGVMLFEE
jgi:hypothetical protein